MVLFPKTGGNYWIVTDIYEQFCAIPVTLTGKGGLFDYGNGAKGLFLVRWQLSEEYTEEYDASRRELFRSYRAAARVTETQAEKLDNTAKMGGACLWASEIEDFPIATTKQHFAEEA